MPDTGTLLKATVRGGQPDEGLGLKLGWALETMTHNSDDNSRQVYLSAAGIGKNVFVKSVLS